MIHVFNGNGQCLERDNSESVPPVADPAALRDLVAAASQERLARLLAKL